LRSSQVCSALQAFLLRFKSLWSAAFGGPAPAPQPAGASRPAKRKKAQQVAAGPFLNCYKHNLF